MTPRSCLKWKLMGRVFKNVVLRWVPTGKTFASSTTKVDSEPPNGSNADITNQCESEQALDVSAGTLLSTGSTTNSRELVDKTNWQMIIKAKVVMEEQKIRLAVNATKHDLLLKHTSPSNLSMDVKTAFLNGPLKREVYVLQKQQEKDADHVRMPMITRKSTSGGIQFLGDKLVSWMSKKQNCTAMSSAEAEYVALSASCAQVMWMRNNFKNIGYNYNKITGPKDSEEDVGMKPTEVNKSEASDKGEEDEHDTRNYAARPSFTNDDPSSPVNAAEASNAFEDHLFKQFSPIKNAFTLSDVPNVSPMDDNTRIFAGAYDDEDVSGQADLNNLETTMNGSSIPTTKINKDHPIKLILEDLHCSSTNKKNEPKKVIQALKDPSWIEAMIEAIRLFLAPGFKDLDHPDKVYKMVKALYGLHQAPRAWYETLANYLLGNGFKRGKIDQKLFIKKQKGDILLVQVYVDDIIFGFTNKELSGILKKFNYTDVKSASTLVDLETPLVKDGDADDVDVHLYRSMIGSLMYLTASRPDIMFAVCACARFQVTPKISHLLAIKRIFRYLKGKPTLGLWLISWQCKKQTMVTTSTSVAEYVVAASCYLLTKGFDARRYVKRGQDTKIPQSSGPPVKVGDEVVHKELGDRMERAATTTSSLEAEQDSDAQTRFETTSKQSNDPPLSRVNTLRSGEDSLKLIELMAHCTTLSALVRKRIERLKQFWQTAALSTNEDEVRGITATIDRK
ncbi:putative ribonuclease H-like domain-containing protein, partial [Tanacetum coccineum]